MKIHCRIVVFFQITISFFSILSAAITECYVCPKIAAECNDPVATPKLLTQKCGEEPEAASNVSIPTVHGASAATTAAAAPAALVERQHESSTESSTSFKCVKVTGKDPNGLSINLRSCMAGGCAHEPTALGDKQCYECDDADLCNSADRINPIDWIVRSIAIILFWFRLLSGQWRI